MALHVYASACVFACGVRLHKSVSISVLFYLEAAFGWYLVLHVLFKFISDKNSIIIPQATFALYTT